MPSVPYKQHALCTGGGNKPLSGGGSFVSCLEGWMAGPAGNGGVHRYLCLLWGQP